MDQTEARRLARARSEATGLIYIAVTRDQHAGRWEQTYEWGVQLPNGEFVADQEAAGR